jgi:hypoxanthine phosphoribosyltransferase
MKPHPLVKEILITKDQINKRSEELAKEISNYYADQNVRDNTVIMIGLLKGCIPFMAKFLEYFDTTVKQNIWLFPHTLVVWGPRLNQKLI